MTALPCPVLVYNHSSQASKMERPQCTLRGNISRADRASHKDILPQQEQELRVLVPSLSCISSAFL